jgi:hypothetical protein
MSDQEEKPDWEAIFNCLTGRKFDRLLGHLKAQCSQQVYDYAIHWADRIASEFQSEIYEVYNIAPLLLFLRASLINHPNLFRFEFARFGVQ